MTLRESARSNGQSVSDSALHVLGRWVIVGEAWQVQELAELYGLQVDQVIQSIEELADDSKVAVDAGLISRRF